MSKFLGKRAKSALNFSQIVKGDALPKKRSPEALYDFFRGRRSKLLFKHTAQCGQLSLKISFFDFGTSFSRNLFLKHIMQQIRGAVKNLRQEGLFSFT